MSASEHLNPYQFRVEEKNARSGDSLIAHHGDQRVGRTEYRARGDNNTVSLDWIESSKRGAGRAMLDHLANKYPQHEIATESATPQGARLIGSFQRRTGREVYVDR